MLPVKKSEKCSSPSEKSKVSKRKSKALPSCIEPIVIIQEMESSNCVQDSCNNSKAQTTTDDKDDAEEFEDPDNTNDNLNVGNTNLILNDSESINILFICDVCDKPFPNKEKLMQHILKHPKLYNCTYCSYRTYRKSDLNTHINGKHTKSAIYSCSYCSYTTYRKGHLGRHVSATHEKTTLFNCTFCSYKTSQKWNLNLHVNAKHTKSTSFVCCYCSYTTYYRSDLNKHIKVKHT